MRLFCYTTCMNVKKTVLKNGLRIITVPMPESPTVTVMVAVAAGTRYETEKNNGISHFLEHMCFKGTQKRDYKQIAYELEAMGATTNAFTDYDMTAYHTKGRAELFPKLLDIVSDVYLNSTFPESEIEKERGVVCGEIDMYNDSPQYKVANNFLEALYGNQPAGYSIAGPKENIKKLTRKDFIDYHSTHYHAEKTVIVIAGKFDEQKSINMVKNAFAAIPSKKIVHKKKVNPKLGKSLFVENKKTDQAHLVLGMRAIPAGHPDRKIFSVMNAVLGKGMSSRLFVKLREEMGAGYYISSGFSSVDDTGEFYITTGTEPKRVGEVITAIKQEVKKLQQEKISKQELEKTQEFLVGNLYMGLELSDSVATMIAIQEVLNQPLKTLKDLEKEIRSVTVDDVLRVAKKYLRPEKFHLAVIGPHTESELKKVM